MPSRSTFNHYNYTESSSKKKTFNVSSFYGVEYQRTQLEGKDYHATDIKNIVYKDKVNQKRSGYEQVAIAPINAEVNGYFEFYDTSGDFHKIMHIGTSLYEVDGLDQETNFWETKFTQITGTMANHKSVGFASKGILYILDGTKYRYLSLNNSSLVLSDVADSSIVYVPTTSIVINDGSSYAYEDVNLLTIWRKNRIEGIKSNSTSFKAILDSSVWEGTLGEKIWDVTLTINGTTFNTAESLDGQEEDGDYSRYYFVESSKRQLSNGVYVYNGSDLASDSAGSLNVYINNENSVVFITTNFIKDVTEDDTPNDIVIKFPHIEYDPTHYPVVPIDYASIINKCTFGIVYNNQLFVSGNPDMPNTDWHTQPTINYGNNESYGDFTYFSDLDYCYYGSDHTAIVGYDIYSDGDLIVIKEPSRNEATIYRRSKELRVATSYTGEEVANQGNTLYEEGYPMFPINNMGGDGGINNRSITNFLGNTLILTKNGLKKLSTKQNIYNKEKFLQDVSSYINLKITKSDLNTAFVFTFKDKLLMKIEDKIYVAYDSLKEDNEYEWYVLDDINADIFFEIDNELYFSDTIGNICRFNTDEYYFKDRDRVYTSLGSAMPSGNTITISGTYTTEISDGDKVLMLGHYSNNVVAPLYYKIGSITSGSNPNRLEFDGYTTTTDNKTKIILNSVNESFYDGLKVYLIGDSVDGTYKLEVVDDTIGQEYYIKNSSNNYVDLSNSVAFSVYVSTKDKNLVVDDYDSTNHTFNLVNELGDAVTFYTTGSTGYSCIITHERNVEALYETKPYDMGSIAYDKTIFQYTIANDTNLESITNLGYLANRKQGTVALARGSQGLRFEAYDFHTVSFKNDGLPHIYTKYRLVPNVNFIRFAFSNDQDSNMVLSQLTFIYMISGQVRGSK